jgi:hypothetical protein
MTVFAEPLVSTTWKLRIETPVELKTEIAEVNVPDTTSATSKPAIARNVAKYLTKFFILLIS